MDVLDGDVGERAAAGEDGLVDAQLVLFLMRRAMINTFHSRVHARFLNGDLVRAERARGLDSTEPTKLEHQIVLRQELQRL